jgi:exosome complex exonuclease DIS3/RRP44
MSNQKIIIGYKKWDSHSSLPHGHFIGLIGEIGNLETESKVILLEHNVEIRNFSQQVLACLPIEGEKWQIPPEEINKRLDLRATNVVSIDPPGCKDIDDALHCVTLPNGNFEVGHIFFFL